MPTLQKPPQSNRQKLFNILNDSLSREDFVKSFASVLSFVKQMQADLTENIQSAIGILEERIDERLAQIKDGEDGNDYILTAADKKEIARSITVPIVERIIETQTVVEKQTPIVTQVIKEVAITETAEEIRTKLKLSTSDISGLEEFVRRFIPSRTIGGVLGWGAHPLTIQGSGVTKVKVARQINFTGATVTHSPDGVTTVAVTGGSGSGFQAPTSGSINGSNAVFVWATAPNVIVVDQGRAMQKVSSDGTVNWTGTITTTLTIAPTSDIYATA